MNDLHDLTLIPRSRLSIAVIETHEEPRVPALLEQAAGLEGRALFVWSLAGEPRRADMEKRFITAGTATRRKYGSVGVAAAHAVMRPA